VKTVVVDDTDTETTSVYEETGPQGDCVKAVVDKFSPPANGAEIRNPFGELVGWLDAGETPAVQELAPDNDEDFLPRCGVV